MKTIRILSLILCFFAAGVATAQNSFEYLSPRPDARMVSKETNIIIRKGDIINPSSLETPNLVTVRAQKSGIHKGKIILADDNKTILFIPAEKFETNEMVSVQLNKGVRNSEGEDIGEVKFGFTTTSLSERIPTDKLKRAITDSDINFTGSEATVGQFDKSDTDSLPADFPKITINSIDNPAPGYVFLTVSREAAGIGYYNMILDNTGSPVNYIKEGHYSYDFKVQKNNLLSYADISESHWYVGGGESTHKVLDSNLTVVDSFRCGNGYVADSHDFQLLPNGHALVFGYDLQPVDMSRVIEGGDPAAQVAGSIIQEIDAKKNVVFEWRSWDYIPITDSYRDLTIAAFDYIHVNAIEPDFDGNILISCRETSDIIKISRTTGEILWRMGGKKNQFTFINENPANAPNYFSLQHSIRRLENGNLILFDNGNQHTPSYSRAVEYKVDEENKTATLVWEYRHSPDVFVSSRGSVQRLPNGNTMIGWGIYSESKNLAATEVTPDKKVVFELSLPKGISSYRAFRFPYRNYSPAASVGLFDLLPINVYSFIKGQVTTGVKVKFSKLNIGYNSMRVIKHNTAPINPLFTHEAPVTSPMRVVIEQEGIDDFKADLRFDKSYLANITDPQKIIVYFRKSEAAGAFEALPTSYDDINKEIVVSVSAFGEFIFCRPYPTSLPGIPLLVSPADKDSVNGKLPLELRWAQKGYTTAYYLQISNDSAFKSLIVDDSSLTGSIYTLTPLQNDTRYYWRVKAICTAGESNFSDAGSFYTIAPFIKITYPNGGENFQPGKDYYIRWQDNISEYVKIKLLRNGAVASIIADSVLSIGAYKFTVPLDFPIDSVFRVEVISLTDTLLSDHSDGVFSVRTSLSAVDNEQVISEYRLDQNYPNPFNPVTSIRYVLPYESILKIKIFNSLGQLIETMVSGIQGRGIYNLTWNASQKASGIYFYSIDAVSTDGKSRLMKVRKMTLLK